jgi:pilus assembly protein CpaB
MRSNVPSRPDGTPGSRTATDAAARRRRAARRYVRAAVWRARFVLVAVCCGLAATATVQAVRPEPPPTIEVVVPEHRLVAGSAVEPEDVTVRAVPAALVPDDVLTDPADAVGRVPAISLPAGLPLHADLVQGGGVVAQAPRGTVVVPVRLDDATTGWLRPGDHVDLVATDGGRATVAGSAEPGEDAVYLARRALVLPGLGSGRDGGSDDAAGGLLGEGSAGSAVSVTLVAVAPGEAPGLSAASGWGTVAAVLVR